MGDYEAYLEKTWNAILSRDKVEILRAFNALDQASRKAMVDHLQKMTSESGWHPEQAKSARSALQAIFDEGNP